MIEPKPNKTLVQLDKETSMWLQGTAIVLRNIVQFPGGLKATCYLTVPVAEIKKLIDQEPPPPNLEVH